MLTKPKRRRNISESTAMRPNMRIDTERGIVFGVKVLGPKSCHGYSYSQQCMEAAVPLYEGKAVNVDHPDRKNLGASRSYRDRFGKLHNSRYVEGRGVFADLHYNKGHQLAEQFEYDVKTDPSNLGLSHNASGDFAASGKCVESINLVRSVDLVADPATNATLFEDRGRRNRMALKVPKKPSKQLRMAKFLEAVSKRPDLRDLLEAAAAEPPADASPAAATPLQATANMAAAVFMDDKMDMAMKRKKIMKLLDLIDDSAMDVDPAAGAEGEEVETPEDAGEEEETPKKPAKKPAGKPLAESAVLKQLLRKDEIRDLCEDAKFKPDSLQMKLLLKVDDDDEVKQLIESWSGDKKPDVRTGLGPRAAAAAAGKPKSKESREVAESKLMSKDDLKKLLL